MSLYALDAIDDALAATGRYRPTSPLEWVWVVLVAGTVASPGFGLPSGGTSSGEMAPASQEALADVLPETLPDLLFVAGAAVVGLWILFVVTGAFLEFPFLRWLRDGDLALRAEVRANWRRALGLAAFRVAVSLVSLAALVGTTVALVGTGADPWTYLLVLVENWVLFALLGLVTGVVAAFTTAFVVPAMWLEERGVVAGWRRVWPVLAGAPKQFLVYAVAIAVLATIGGLLVGVAVVVALLPALVVALAVGATVGGMAGVGAGAALGGTFATVAAGLVYAFVQVFLRYYALFVLGDVEPELDAIPERRTAIRTDGGSDDDLGTRAGPSDRGGEGGDGGSGGDGRGDSGGIGGGSSGDSGSGGGGSGTDGDGGGGADGDGGGGADGDDENGSGGSGSIMRAP